MPYGEDDDEHLLEWLAGVRKGVRIEQRAILGAGIVILVLYGLQLWSDRIYTDAMAVNQHADKIIQELKDQSTSDAAGADATAAAIRQSLKLALSTTTDRLEALSGRLHLIKWITIVAALASTAVPIWWARGIFLLSNRSCGTAFQASESKRRAMRWGAIVSLIVGIFRVFMIFLHEKPAVGTLISDGLMVGAGLTLLFGHESILQNAARTIGNDWLELKTRQILYQVFFVPIGLAMLMLGVNWLKLEPSIRSVALTVFMIGTGLMLGRFRRLLKTFEHHIGEALASS